MRCTNFSALKWDINFLHRSEIGPNRVKKKNRLCHELTKFRKQIRAICPGVRKGQNIVTKTKYHLQHITVLFLVRGHRIYHTNRAFRTESAKSFSKGIFTLSRQMRALFNLWRTQKVTAKCIRSFIGSEFAR